MNTADVLRRAKAIIAKPENWTTRHYAKDSQGHSVIACDPDAVCWCSQGAVLAAGFDGPSRISATRVLINLVGDIVAWNDAPERTHAEVLEAFDKAIALAERADP